MSYALGPHLDAGDFEIKLHDHEFKLNDVPIGEKVFFFTRDPVSRFISAFYSRKRRGLPRIEVPWIPSEEVAFSRFSTPNELALALSSTNPERRAASVDAMKSILHIQSPHWTWFKDESSFLARQSDILFIGFQETLNEDFSLLKRILNLPDGVTLPDDEVAAHRNPTGVDKRLDDQAIRNLKAWYRRDYQFLELCQKIAAQIRSDLEGGRPRPSCPRWLRHAVMAGRSRSPQAHSTDDLRP